MENTYTYNPTDLVKDNQGIVLAVDFTITASDGTDEFTINGHTGLGKPSETIIPYEQLTQAQVIDWIKNLVGEQTQEQADAELEAYKLRKSNPLTTGTPWSE